MSENTQMASLRNFNQTLMNEKTKEFIVVKKQALTSATLLHQNNTEGLQKCDPL